MRRSPQGPPKARRESNGLLHQLFLSGGLFPFASARSTSAGCAVAQQAPGKGVARGTWAPGEWRRGGQLAGWKHEAPQRPRRIFQIRENSSTHFSFPADKRPTHNCERRWGGMSHHLSPLSGLDRRTKLRIEARERSKRSKRLRAEQKFIDNLRSIPHELSVGKLWATHDNPKVSSKKRAAALIEIIERGQEKRQRRATPFPKLSTGSLRHPVRRPSPQSPCRPKVQILVTDSRAAPSCARSFLL